MNSEERLKKLGNILLFIIIFCLLSFFGLILLSDAKFTDFFTTGRVTALQDRPKNIEKEIVVDAVSIVSKDDTKILTENIINGISNKQPNWRFIVLCSSGNENLFSFGKKNVKIIPVNYYCSNSLIFMRDLIDKLSFGLFRDQLTQLIFFGKIYFNKHCCDLIFDPCAESTVNDYSIPKISIIHDMMYADLANLFSSDELKWKRENSKRIAESSAKIVTISKFSKDRILHHLKVDPDFVQIIPIRLPKRNIADNSLTFSTFQKEVLKKFHLKKQKYIIYPSAVCSHKNHMRLIDAFIDYLKDDGNADLKAELKLVIVGTADKEALSEISKIIAPDINEIEDLREKIVVTQFLSGKEFDVILSNALAMFFPSLYEGLGMPIIGAMQAGVPVACSYAAGLPEVAGDAALFFNPYSEDTIKNAINGIINNKGLRSQLIRDGYEQAKIYTGEDSMINAYIKLFEANMR